MEVKEIMDWFCVEVHTLAKAKGWYEHERSVHELVALIFSEIGEAVESLRTGEASDKIEWAHGIQEECADIVIRICDMCAYLGIDLGTALAEYMPGYEYTDSDNQELAFIHLMDEMQEGNISNLLPIERLAKVGENIGLALQNFIIYGHPHNMGKDLVYSISEIAGLLHQHDYDCYLGCAIMAKHEFNKSRPRRHGGKRY